ncbi:unnamed protein product [Adineta ricciae]|uniref:Uncharacterized protein n=1 Tax=Adineta ricciae TaxID=249248 RepID=A0A815B206_ADIRI|nr:unnamed protein product [Adineta ricciae]
MLDPTIRQNPIGFLETELHWNPTGKIPSKIQEIHVSDPTWDRIPSESNAIPSPGFHRIRPIPVGSDKILYWIPVWDCSTWDQEMSSLESILNS